ncbi:PLP-dependent aminotransferase family protein [Bradyrhizobium sp. Tv2a-2]|uniref:aminotransferase-like domain-containing protein n=1 Tax=Bradyrhizobium sp. Tv2a-2 TaxID=113395 RepID=UPI00041C9D86|nr:PLP-dependent aminotransferase family protein [Bradyrhizobium sp. Tv2a-2]
MTPPFSNRCSLARGFTAFNYSDVKRAINFGYGLPDPVMFAELAWPNPFTGHTGVAPVDLPQYTDAAGLPELRARLALRYGVRHDEIMLTSGASQALQLVAEAWINPGDVVLTEDPSYLGALRTFSVLGASVVQLSMGADGADLDELEAVLRKNARVKLFYTTPSFHNPTGRYIPRTYMGRLAALLAHHGLPLVQDLVYAELPYAGAVDWLPPGGNVINLHSISKIAGPGLRLGWVLAESEIIKRLVRLKLDGGVSPITSNVVLSLLQSGALDAHICRLRQHYRTKRDDLSTLLQCSPIFEPDYVLPSGGFSFWLQLVAATDAEAFIEAARRQYDVHLVHGRNYGPQSVDHVRLCFSYLPMSAIEQGLALLGDLHAKL